MKLKINTCARIALLFAFLALGNFAWAQRTVTGTVIDGENNEPLIGATVIVVGTSTGAITDFDGKFEIQIPEGSNELEFSYTGYGTRKMEVGASNVMDVTLNPGTVLDEVVVVGYGSVKKSDATGAVTVVGEEDFNKGVISSPEELIQGRAAGVQITTASGEPGGGINIRIRGTSSVRSNNNPLFVVDGVPLSGDNTQAGGSNAGLGSSSARNPLNFLNPNDIASIDILKDASATAIYGSRGANGVVIITTKSGQAGQSTMDYAVSAGFSNITRKYDLLSAEEYIAGYATFNGQAAANDINLGANTDWQDEIFRTAFTHSHNLSYGGGDASGNYRFSLAYMDQEGIVEKSSLERITGRFNGSRKFFDNKLTIQTQFTVANNRDNAVPITDNSGFRGDLLGAALKLNPTQPVRNPDGTFLQQSITEANPVAILNLSEGFVRTLRSLGNISGEYKFTDELSFKTVLGFDRSTSNRVDAFSKDLVIGDVEGVGRLFLGDVEIANKLWENYFTYNKDFGTVNFTGLLGYSYQEFDVRTKSSNYADFETSDLDVMINNQASANVAASGNSSRSIDELQSFFGRVNLGFSSKYLITATLRADGSTRFGGNNKYGYFPSFAFKWRLIEESFVPEGFTDLGLRLGYGVTGNQEIPHNVYQVRQRYGDRNVNNDASNINGGGLGAVSFANPDLKWETTSQINIGVDFGFLNNRLSGSLDLYRKNTNDLLFQVQAAQPAPAPFQWDNLDADVINQGIELGINGVAVDNADFSWDVNFNIAYNKNEVQNFGSIVNTGAINGQGLTGAFAQRIADGQPLFAYFVRDFIGFNQEGTVQLYNGGDVQQFVDKSPLPKVNAGLTNTFRFGDVDFSFFFTGQFGHWIYSNTRNAYFTAGSLGSGRNVTRDVIGNGEAPTNAPDVSSRFLEKGDFIRLQNLSLGYNVPLQSDVFSSLRLYVTGQNLFVITDYSGQDPEVNVNKAIDGVPSFGIDFTTYPRARTILFGANVSF